MNISRYLSFMVLPLLALLAFHSSPAHGCTCFPNHPQTSFCTAGYIAIVRILKKSYSLKPQHTVYKVETKKTYKKDASAHKMLKYGLITTPKEASLCSLDLEVGKLYMIAGSGLNLNGCDYVKTYLELSLTERRGMAGGYRKACRCKVKMCNGESCLRNSETSTGCKWKPFGCETRHSACVPTTYQTPEGAISKCHWRRTAAYKQCLADPENWWKNR